MPGMGKLQPYRLLWNLIVIHTIPNFMCQTTMFHVSVSWDKSSSQVVILSRNYFDTSFTFIKDVWDRQSCAGQKEDFFLVTL